MNGSVRARFMLEYERVDTSPGSNKSFHVSKISILEQEQAQLLIFTLEQKKVSRLD